VKNKTEIETKITGFAKRLLRVRVKLFPASFLFFLAAKWRSACCATTSP